MALESQIVEGSTSNSTGGGEGRGELYFCSCGGLTQHLTTHCQPSCKQEQHLRDTILRLV